MMLVYLTPITLLDLNLVGDCFCDLANLSMMYFMPQGTPGITGIAGLDLEALGIPTRQELIRHYCRASQRSFDTAMAWSGFYLAFLFFKNCVIVQGVAQRAKAGLASSAQANKVAALLPRMIELTQFIFEEHPPPQSSRL